MFSLKEIEFSNKFARICSILFSIPNIIYSFDPFVLSFTEIPLLELYIPLKFFFNKYKGLSLPIIALQYHEVILKFNFRSLYHLINTDLNESLLGGNKIIKDEDEMELKLFCNYIFLDKDERLRFAQSPHEYLIEQVQYEKKNLNSCGRLL